MKGDTEKAKMEINAYNRKADYYHFADCTTYPGKILVMVDYDDTITYSAKENDKLKSYIITQSMIEYFNTLARVCSWFQD